MELEIKKQKALFNKSDFGDSRNIVTVEFPNCVSLSTGKPFLWVPTYSQLEEIKKNLDEIEVESWGATKDEN